MEMKSINSKGFLRAIKKTLIGFFKKSKKFIGFLSRYPSNIYLSRLQVSVFSSYGAVVDVIFYCSSYQQHIHTISQKRWYNRSYNNATRQQWKSINWMDAICLAFWSYLCKLGKSMSYIQENIFFNRAQSFLGTNAKDCPLHCIRLSIFWKDSTYSKKKNSIYKLWLQIIITIF